MNDESTKRAGTPLRDRIDAFADAPGVLNAAAAAGAYGGEVLSEEMDDELQAIVSELTHALGAPMGLVSVVTQRSQFFRAHQGLSEELAHVRATDRDVSFCQFVVRDGARFEVNDAPADPRVPQELVNRFGIRSYLGSPICVGDTVIGSLCAIDVRARQFSTEEKTVIDTLATRVSARMVRLAGERAKRSSRLLTTAAAPAFEETRNIMSVLLSSVAELRIAAQEVRPLARLAERYSQLDPKASSAAVLVATNRAVTDLGDITADAEDSARRLKTQLDALERFVVHAGAKLHMQDVLGSAIGLSLHMTKLVGGVRIDGPVQDADTAAPAAMSISIVSTTLTALARWLQKNKQRGPLAVRTSTTPNAVTLAITVSEHKDNAALGADICATLSATLPDSPLIQWRPHGAGVELVFAVNQG